MCRDRKRSSRWRRVRFRHRSQEEALVASETVAEATDLEEGEARMAAGTGVGLAAAGSAEPAAASAAVMEAVVRATETLARAEGTGEQAVVAVLQAVAVPQVVVAVLQVVAAVWQVATAKLEGKVAARGSQCQSTGACGVGSSMGTIPWRVLAPQ